MTGSSPFTVMTNILSLISMKTFRENSNTTILVSPFSFQLVKISFFLNIKHPVVKINHSQLNSNGGSSYQCINFCSLLMITLAPVNVHIDFTKMFTLAPVNVHSNDNSMLTMAPVNVHSNDNSTFTLAPVQG